MRRVPVQAGPRPPTRARLFLVVVAGALGLWLLAGARASAAPVISGADGDVWNAARPVPSYVITTDAANRKLSWSVAGVASGTGRSPLTVRLSGVGDGQYRLAARDKDAGTERAFRVNVTPPRITVLQPTRGMQVEQNARLSAAYSCQDAVVCTGTVDRGAPLDTSQAGPAAFSVRALDDAGNEALSSVDYLVRAALPSESVLLPAGLSGHALPRGPVQQVRAVASRHPQRSPPSAGSRRHHQHPPAPPSLAGSPGGRAVQRPGLPTPRAHLAHEGGVDLASVEPVQGARRPHRVGQPVRLAGLALPGSGLSFAPARPQLLLRPSPLTGFSRAAPPPAARAKRKLRGTDAVALTPPARWWAKSYCADDAKSVRRYALQLPLSLRSCRTAPK